MLTTEVPQKWNQKLNIWKKIGEIVKPIAGTRRDEEVWLLEKCIQLPVYDII